MKLKRTLLLIAPAMLLASCNPSAKTTTINKINLSGVKTLVMGKLSSSTNESSEDETLITVTEDEQTGESTAEEATYEVETGNSTSTVSDITIQRLVKLNKNYAVVSCTYKDVTYDLIVDLSTGSCVKFPDSSLLPNSKEKLGGHRAYRKYIKNKAYLNNSVAQPNEDENIFYYINYYQTTQDETTIDVRCLVKLDLTDISKPSAKILVAPEFENEGSTIKYSVQSFAVDCDGHVAYYATDKANLNEATDHKYLYYYNSENPAIEIKIKDTTNYQEIEPYFYAMGDGNIYCYLKNNFGKHQLASLEVTESEPITVEAVVSKDLADAGAADSLPTKLLNIKYPTGTGESQTITMRSFAVTNANSGSKGAVVNELFSNTKSKQPKLSYVFDSLQGGHKPSWPDRKPGKPNQSVGGSNLSEVLDGFSANKYGYLFGIENNKRVFKRIKYSSDSYSIDTTLTDLLSKYLSSLESAEVEEVEADGDTDDTTVIVDDAEESGESTSTAVVEIDEKGNEEEIEEIDDASEVVDVND